MTDIKRVVSLSLGSSLRNKAVQTQFLGEPFSIERIGTDGDTARLKSLLRELDGKVDAIGLGGTNLYLSAGDRRYLIRASAEYARIPKITPVTDGYGIKRYVEPEMINQMDRDTPLKLGGRRVLHVCGVDRWGMAEAMTRLGAKVIFGDLMFALEVPIPIPSIRILKILAVSLLPIITLASTEQLGYPTGASQEQSRTKYEKYYRWADYISGDFHFIRKHLPKDLKGKVIITNTVTEDDVKELQKRGVRALVTLSPRFEGRAFGTNVLDGVLVALLKKHPDELTRSDYLDFAEKLNWRPHVEVLN